MSREDLLQALENIGWKRQSEMNGYAWRLEDHKGNTSKFLLKSDHVEIRDPEAEASFYYKDCGVEPLDGSCVSLYAKDNKSVFINFYGGKRATHQPSNKATEPKE